MKGPRRPRRTREADGPAGELILYQTEDGESQIECRLDGGTVWLTQALLARLFQTTVANINTHIRNILREGEATEATIKHYLMVRRESGREVRRQIKHYNLDMILAVGYRVSSGRGTQFRQWATARLSEYLVKGFVLDDERLKDPDPRRTDYFDEILERIRDIRSSEKRIYLKVRDIFALAADYRPDSAQTQEFFKVIQNKLHWAATGQTAAELIAARADADQPNMGLTSWKGTKVRKGDVTVAKNYLREPEIGALNRIVSMYLDYAEDQARRRRVLYMQDWREKLDAFLRFNERAILANPGKVSKEVADRLAEGEYEKFRLLRLRLETEAEQDAFEAAVKKLPPKKNKGR